MDKIAEYVTAKTAWVEAMRGVVAVQRALSVARRGETKAYRALIAITQSMPPIEVAEADEQWRKNAGC